MSKADTAVPFWADEHGQPLTCTEKLRTLREDEAELRALLQETYDDAVLMGVDPIVMRARLSALIEQLESSFHKKEADRAMPGEPS